MVHRGTLSDDGNVIKWDNGSFWEKKLKPKQIVVNKHANDSKKEIEPLFEKNENVEKLQEIVPNEKISKKVEVAVPKNGKTVEIEGEIEEIEDDDFEQDFDSYFKENVPSLEIENHQHFVLINDDELFDMKRNDVNVDDSKVDEWLLV